MRDVAGPIGGVLFRRRGIVALVVVAVTVVLGFGLTGLGFETSQDTMIESTSQVAVDNRAQQATFGGEPMLVLFTGDIAQLFNAQNLPRMERMEAELRATGQFASVIGPVTALQFAEQQLTIAPDLLASQPELLAQEVARFGAAGEASFANPAFVSFLVRGVDGSIRPAMRDNFLDDTHALMIVRLPGNASIAEQGPASDLVKQIVDRNAPVGFDVVATGPPVLLKEINDYLQGGMALLGGVALGMMVVVLALVFRARWRLLPLGIVAVGSLWAFGALGYLGVPLTMVTISGLPVLIGLGVDFAVQMQGRLEEELARGGSPRDAVRAAFRHMVPPLLVAMVAAIAGFASLQLSKVPMVRDFGVLLTVGVLALVVAAIVLSAATLAGLEVRRPRRTSHRPGRLERVLPRIMTLGRGVVVPAVIVGLVVASAGFVVEDRIPVQTDPERWVDQNGAAVAELDRLREGTGFSSELTILVQADDVLATPVVQWMDEFARQQTAEHPELLRATSLTAITASITEPDGDSATKMLSVAPPDVARFLVSADRTRANLVFPIAPVSLADRARLLDEMQAQLDPPPGVRATPAGLAVVGVELVAALEANRRAMTLLSLAGVLVWLLLAYRRLGPALLPLVPVVMAAGLTLFAIFALGLELTPLSTVAAPLVIAIATEFAVLLVARYVEERQAGSSRERAMVEGATHIARAFVASGLTLVAGFAVLALSPMPLLRDFGIVVAVSVSIALVCALVVLPPLLLLADRGEWMMRRDRGPVVDLRADGRAPTDREIVRT